MAHKIVYETNPKLEEPRRYLIESLNPYTRKWGPVLREYEKSSFDTLTEAKKEIIIWKRVSPDQLRIVDTQPELDERTDNGNSKLETPSRPSLFARVKAVFFD